MKAKTKVYTQLTFAEILEDAIKRSPYNNSDVAEQLGVTKGAVSNWVGGGRRPNIDLVIKWCYLLDIDLYYLIGATIPAGELRSKEQELLLLFQKMNAQEKAAVLGICRALVAKRKCQKES